MTAVFRGNPQHILSVHVGLVYITEGELGDVESMRWRRSLLVGVCQDVGCTFLRSSYFQEVWNKI